MQKHLLSVKMCAFAPFALSFLVSIRLHFVDLKSYSSPFCVHCFCLEGGFTADAFENFDCVFEFSTFAN